MDDFFVPKKHNFHPRDVIADIKTLNGKVFYFDNDFRNYNHEGKNISQLVAIEFILQKSSKIINSKKILSSLKTKKGKDQILDVKYSEKIINENLKLIKKIRNAMIRVP